MRRIAQIKAAFGASLLLIMSMSAACAEEWRVLSGTEIDSTLSGQVLDYDSAWQDFRESGKTLYNAGEDSWGYWRVQGDKYCSQWPPRDVWDCFEVARQGERIRFEGAFGDVTIGAFRQ